MIQKLVTYTKESLGLMFRNPILLVITGLEFLAFYLLVRAILAISITEASMYVVPNIIKFSCITILSSIFQSGKLNMIKEGVVTNTVKIEYFFNGIRKYFIKFIILSIILIVLSIPVAIVIGLPIMFLSLLSIDVFFIMTCTILIAILIYSFIRLTSVILVYENCNVVDALNKSMDFAQKNFLIVFVLNLFETFLTKVDNTNIQKKEYSTVPQLMLLINSLALPLLIIGTIISILAQTFFEIAFFQIYHDRRNVFFNQEVEDESSHCQ